MFVKVLIVIAILHSIDCQVYYQPVQVLIPTVSNGSYFPSNYSIYNHTNNSNNYNYRPPSHPSYYPKTNNNNNSYANNGSQDGHLFLGIIQPFDRLLYNQEITKTKRFWSSREKIIEYPKDLPPGYARHEIISAIRIYNQFLDGRGAKAIIEDGGIGRLYVKIRLLSPFGKGLRYVVQIFGR